MPDMDRGGEMQAAQAACDRELAAKEQAQFRYSAAGVAWFHALAGWLDRRAGAKTLALVDQIERWRAETFCDSLGCLEERNRYGSLYLRHSHDEVQ